MGFSEVVTEPRPEKYIIVMAPHTSNWDFIIGILYAHAEGFRSNFLMKKEWFFWPMGKLMRKLGGIPVYRDKKMGSTDRLAALAMESKEFHLCLSLLGCGWPNNKNYKWADAKALVEYAAAKAGDIKPMGEDVINRRERKLEQAKNVQH